MSYGGFIPRFLKSLHTIFHSGCINLHSHQQCKSIPFSPHFLQLLLFVDFDDGHSEWCEMILNLVLICISLIMSDVEHLFMCLLTICMFSQEKCLFRYFAHFLTEFSIFLVLSCRCCLHILEINSLQLFHLLLFSPIFRAIFSPCLQFSLLCKNFSVYLGSIFFNFCFYFHYSGRWVIEDLAVIYVRRCSAYVFLWEFYGFWSYIYVINPFLVYFCVWCQEVQNIDVNQVKQQLVN